MYGSAAVIGLQMVPILEPEAPEAFDRARDLGIAFQLANFIRDVNEDLDRGRVYLPLDELAEFEGAVGRLDPGEVVEFGDGGGLGQVLHLTDQPGAVGGFAVLQFHHRVIQRAMVATMEDQNLGPSGDGAGNAQGEAVGIGGGGGDLPAEITKAFGQQPAGLQRRLLLPVARALLKNLEKSGMLVRILR